MSRLYAEAGRIVQSVIDGKMGLKAALYNEAFGCNAGAVCALATRAVGHRKRLEGALRHAGLLGTSKREGAGKGSRVGGDVAEDDPVASSRGMAIVMAYDLLLGQGLRGGGRIRRLLVQNKPALEEGLRRTGTEHDPDRPSSSIALAVGSLPRYLRINRSLVGSGPDAAASLRQLLQKRLRAKMKSQPVERDVLHKKDTVLERGVSDVEVQLDELVPDVLVVPHEARPLLHGMDVVEDGRLIMQDRSSCLSALSGGIEPGCVVLDACAAPGSKTAHAIDLLDGRGRMIACERNPQRAVTLMQRLRKLVGLRRIPGKTKSTILDGAPRTREDADDDAAWFDALSADQLTPGTTWHFQTAPKGVGVEIHVGDFLACDPTSKPFCDVEVVLADPSCSGSGLPEHHLEAGTASSPGKQRLRKLAAFQGRILHHALSFPCARTVVYSTCSTHREENEDVVAAVLSALPQSSFTVAEALPWWKNGEASGDPGSRGGNGLHAWVRRCIRCDPAVHRCRGFFLCRLERLAKGSKEAVEDFASFQRGKRHRPAETLAGASAPVRPLPESVRETQQRRSVAVRRQRRRQSRAAAKVAASCAANHGVAVPAPAPENRSKKKRKLVGLRIVK
eukprot:TRINITY_DN51532_c0_g1_i1.p1 TRINITY_DN51532_c0_g1~~TRINITY_DN51532_c0_g1_i1.p1  ORF type:complete len:620 (+),score=88.42 TRINITY_DN51532_c0_g1_i1:84-1943(+)